MAVCHPESLLTLLRSLNLKDMPEWKQWHALDFPKLEKLSIENCAKLTGKLPENLCSLKDLKISRCPEISLKTAIQLSSLKWFQVIGCPEVFDEAQLFISQLEGLYIDDCNSLMSLPFSILPSTLKRVRIHGCQKLKVEGPVGEIFLEYLELKACDCISPELLPRACELCIGRCPNLTRFSIPTETETLYIGCENVEKLSVACGYLPSAVTHLSIHGCLNLKRLPEHMQELLPSLKELELSNCPELESFPEGGLPVNLQCLCIRNCTKLVNGRKEWHLKRLPYLRELAIEYDGIDEDIKHWELPGSIQRLEVYNLKTLSSQVLKSLTSLEYLCIEGNLPQIQSLLVEGKLPSSLSQLRLHDHHELHSLGLCHLSSLQILHIKDCPNIRSFPESAVPSSLSRLAISNCRNLQSLSESAPPSSFSDLTIINCSNLRFLPVYEMPSSLSNLVIGQCPLLRPLLEFGKGEYWTNIAQIPNIMMDWECL